MAYLKFLDSNNLIPCTVSPAGNVVTLEFPGSVIVDKSGFRLYLDPEGEHDIGGEDYLGYTTIYRNDDVTAAYNGYQLSNDGSVWIPPEPIPEPEPEPLPEPTLEELREAKVQEMNALQQTTIQSGVNVTLSDGTVEHFTLTEHDQTSLVGLQSKVAAGEEAIPWHTSDEMEHCKFYSNTDMQLIVSAAMAWVTWHVTYFRDLRIYIRSLESKEAVSVVSYGMELPEAYQSEPLKVMIAAQAGDIV
jgi:hypothetical protein|nr:MAG TPA: protein of unknown function (DUF4376) [Caudoviricetes sp.]